MVNCPQAALMPPAGPLVGRWAVALVGAAESLLPAFPVQAHKPSGANYRGVGLVFTLISIKITNIYWMSALCKDLC